MVKPLGNLQVKDCQHLLRRSKLMPKEYKIKITSSDLSMIKDYALRDYKDKHLKDHSPDLFVVRCYLDGVIALLNTKGIKIEIEETNSRWR
jgi:hypothetical protein